MNNKDRKPKIHPTAIVDDTVSLGDWSVINANVTIRGNVEIGRAAWIDEYSVIGGGQRELGSFLCGDFLHMGIRSFINIADMVAIGNEVGLGMETKLFTHGGYLDRFRGFPYESGPIVIGSDVWIPKATVLPNVVIGESVVIAAESLVNKNIPSGCLAGGVPAKVIKEKIYPDEPNNEMTTAILRDISRVSFKYGINKIEVKEAMLLVGNTIFSPIDKIIKGPVTKDTERVKDLFRRFGLRFRYYDNGGEYAEWD
jgi:acetyltransferase-like isoleucine patch superfamily enzyme